MFTTGKYFGTKRNQADACRECRVFKRRWHGCNGVTTHCTGFQIRGFTSFDVPSVWTGRQASGIACWVPFPTSWSISDLRVTRPCRAPRKDNQLILPASPSANIVYSPKRQVVVSPERSHTPETSVHSRKRNDVLQPLENIFDDNSSISMILAPK